MALSYNARIHALECCSCGYAAEVRRSANPEQIAIMAQQIERRHRCRQVQRHDVRVFRPGDLKVKLNLYFGAAVRRAEAEMEREFVSSKAA